MAEKPATSFVVPGSLRVERFRRREGPTPCWVVWKPGTSQGVSGESQEAFKALLKLCAWPASTPTGQRLREWLEAWGYVREKKKAEPLTVSQEVQATGFGPEAHLDESDPNYQTKMIT